ncbi:MAG: hypothetical protein H0V07_07055, partial [Propionibacteriales bacterium]|nr:hypothetical protein [Propionibacteriales bacterium]
LSVLRSFARLRAIDPRFVGWVGVAAMLCVAVAALCLLTVERIGSGPPLVLGAMAGVFGLILGHQVGRPDQLMLAIITSGFAAGALLGGAAGVSATLPDGLARIVAVAWAVPLVAVWPVLVRLSAHRAPGGNPDVVVHPPAWVVVLVTVAIGGWSVLTMLVEPAGVTGTAWSSWEDSWSVLLLVVAVALLLTTVVGFDPRFALVWLRPTVIVATAAAVAGWGLVMIVLPTQTARLAFVGVAVVGWLVPATATFAVARTDGEPARVGWLVVAILVVAAVGGAALAACGQLAVIPVGLAVMSVTAAAGWVMPMSHWAMLSAVAPLLAAAAAVLAGGFRLAATDSEASRLVGLAAVCALVLGGVVAIATSWAMLGDVPVDADGFQAAGRLYAGLTVAVTSVAASWTWAVRGRILESVRVADRSATAEHGSVIDLGDLADGEPVTGEAR